MSKIFRFDCYPHDWLLDTSRLTPEDRGIYVQIVMLIYARGGQIDNDPKWISGSCNCSSRLVAAAISRLVGMDFIQLSDGIITQRRADRELSAKRAQIESGANGGRRSSEIKRGSLEISDLPQRPSTDIPPSSNPIPNPTEPTSPARASAKEIFDWLEGYFNSPNPLIMAPVHAWLDWGADFELDIRPAAERHMKRKNSPPGSLTWLEEDIMRSLTQRSRPRPDFTTIGSGAQIGAGKAEPIILTPEQEARQRAWFLRLGKQHPIYNPEGVCDAGESA